MLNVDGWTMFDWMMIIERGLSTIYTIAGVCDEYPQTCVVVKKNEDNPVDDNDANRYWCILCHRCCSSQMTKSEMEYYCVQVVLESRNFPCIILYLHSIIPIIHNVRGPRLCIPNVWTWACWLFGAKYSKVWWYREPSMLELSQTWFRNLLTELHGLSVPIILLYFIILQSV